MKSDFGISVSGIGLSDGSADDIAYGFTEANICGASAACTVYRMRHDGLRVAVKRLKSEYLSNPLYVAAYRKEFMIGRRLKHDALPLYRDFHESPDDVYIIMDYVDGVRLDEFAGTEAGRAYFGSADNVRRFLEDLLNVTAYFHRSGVIHCDLKPANIMLRHSDMGVMLIDLDKAYTDTLDLTHGGTKNSSDPMEPGRRPTAQKDFAAIGMIIDFIDAAVPDFPKSSCVRFRRECGSGAANADRLKKALVPRNVSRFGLVAGAAAIPVAMFLLSGYFLMYRAKDKPEPVTVSSPRVMGLPPEDEDTVAAVVQVAEIKASVDTGRVDRPAADYHPELQITPADIDKRFRHVMNKIENGYRKVRTESMTAYEITDMMQEIGRVYQAEYGNVRKVYCAEYPRLSPADVENALCVTYAKSETSRAYMAFMQECSDSVDVRLAAGIH